MPFVKAERSKVKLKMVITGISGSGKTMTSLRIATGMGGKVALIDTERGSSALYADRYDFDIMILENHHPSTYVKAIQEAESAGYDVLIIDSISHEWIGRQGELEIADQEAARSASGNTFAGWRKVTPLHNAFLDAIIASNCHIIATARLKTEYEVVKDERTGKTKPQKIGLTPVQKDGIEYEFSIIGTLDLTHKMVIDKTRFSEIDGMVLELPDEKFGEELVKILAVGYEPPKPPYGVLLEAFEAAGRSQLELDAILTVAKPEISCFDAAKSKVIYESVLKLADSKENISETIMRILKKKADGIGYLTVFGNEGIILEGEGINAKDHLADMIEILKRKPSEE